MPVMLSCISHTPVMRKLGPAADIATDVTRAIDTAHDALVAFDPDLIVLFAPDHLNSFFYNLMPPFCIGALATSLGDYDTLSGPLSVPTGLAVECAAAVLQAGVDLAVSHKMTVDHGFSQPLELLTGGIDRYPVIPLFINSIAKPMPTLRRAYQFGLAVGEYFATSHAGKKIAIIGSGGLSHDPPIPTLETGSPETRAALIEGVSRTPAQQVEQEERVLGAAKAFTAASAELGGGKLLPLNPQWDTRIIELLASGDFSTLTAMTDESVASQGGCGGHEIRTWIAAFACLSAFGSYAAQTAFYHPIPEWIAGFALVNAAPT